ncbi:hypothetical protein LTR37_004685 [Vermiconidia calcicola]|uniref:Uncharacterized protein n=1 Tax=Vermiconidia calcicola TaxID=1690605 RepID=A0ACC3NPE4_9PEZI|nr:hypothetical protein LTR37_004685 [Vermiconidia calcicola]
MQDCGALQRPQFLDILTSTTNTLTRQMSWNANGETGRCYLLELPAELRIDIYELALKQSDIFVGMGYSGKRTTVELVNKHPLALTETCKQIREECGDLFFQLNEVTVHMPWMCQNLNKVRNFYVNRTCQTPPAQAHFTQVEQSLREKCFPSNIRYLRIQASRDGRAVWNANTLGTWLLFAPVVEALGNKNMILRLSYPLRYESVTYASIPYEFPVSDEEQSLAAVNKCFAKVEFEDHFKEKAEGLHARFRDNVVKRIVRALQERENVAQS